MNEVLLHTTATMMKDKYTRVCDTNNLGVEHLEAGHFESARVAFAEAIQAARELAKAFVDNDDEDNMWPGCEAPFQGTAISSPDLLFLTSTIHTHGERDCSSSSLNATTNVAEFASSDDGAFIYHRAFKFRRDRATPHLEIICCAILYNMVSLMIDMKKLSFACVTRSSPTPCFLWALTGNWIPYPRCCELFATKTEARNYLLQPSSVDVLRRRNKKQELPHHQLAAIYASDSPSSPPQ